MSLSLDQLFHHPALDAIAAKLGTRARGLVGRSLGLSPAGR